MRDGLQRHYCVPFAFSLKLYVVKDYTQKDKNNHSLAFSSIGPPDGTVIVTVDGTDMFPLKMYYVVLEKLSLLGITPLLSKYGLIIFYIGFFSISRYLSVISGIFKDIF